MNPKSKFLSLFSSSSPQSQTSTSAYFTPAAPKPASPTLAMPTAKDVYQGMKSKGLISSNPAATGTKPATITPPSNTSSLSSPAAQSFMSQFSAPSATYGSSFTDTGGRQGIATFDPMTGKSLAPQPQPEQSLGVNNPQSAYVKYLNESFNSDTANTYQKNKEDAYKKLADIQSNEEQISTEARRRYESILDKPGGLLGGAQQAATLDRRRSNQELADIALQESAATRSAALAKDTYDSYIAAGKSASEAEEAAQKTQRESAFSLSEGQVRYELNSKTGQYEQVGSNATSATSEGNELLSPTEAQALNVPYGTTKAQAYGATPEKPLTVDQAKARQFATAAENADRLLASSTYQLGNIELPFVPNLLKGEQRQAFEQAARAFVNATLRRESGATITDSEFTNKYKELIPAAGDKPAVLQQKKAAREAAVLSIKDAGGYTGSQSSSGAGVFAEQW